MKIRRMYQYHNLPMLLLALALTTAGLLAGPVHGQDGGTASSTEEPPTPSLFSSPDFTVVLSESQAPVLAEQINQFNQDHPDINAQIKVVPDSDFQAFITTSGAIHSGFDVALLSNNAMASLVTTNALLPVSKYPPEAPPLDDFFSDALTSVTYQDDQWGIPIERRGCVTRYDTLVVPSFSQHADVAVQLIQYLASSAQQIKAHETVDAIFPTSKTAYTQLELNCPVQTPVFASFDQTVSAIKLTDQLNADLGSDFLQGKTLNPQEASAGAPDDNTIWFVSAPIAVTEPITREEFGTELSSENGAVIGGISVPGEPVVFEDTSTGKNATLSGEYAISCKGNLDEVESITCVAKNDKETLDFPMIVDQPQVTTPIPTTSIYQGSLGSCWWLILCFCSASRH